MKNGTDGSGEGRQGDRGLRPGSRGTGAQFARVKGQLRVWTQIAVFLFLGIGLAGSAHARFAWNRASICAVNMNGPQSFAFADDPTTSTQRLESVWSTDAGKTWATQVLTSSSTQAVYPLREDAIACASDGSNQALVVVRDTGGGLYSADRLSGWQLSYFGGAASTSLTMIRVFDQGRSKFVLFAGAADPYADNPGSNIREYVYDDLATPKWTEVPVSATGAPTITYGHRADMAAYSVNVGNNGMYALISLFVIDDSGNLWELRSKLGPATQPVGWHSWGAPSNSPTGQTRFSNAPGYGPVAMAAFDSIQGHPGNINSGEYNRWVFLTTGDNLYNYVLTQPADGYDIWALNYSWKAITNPPEFNLSGGLAAGCFIGGEPCTPTPAWAGVSLYPYTGIPYTYSVFDWYGGKTDGSSGPPYSGQMSMIGGPVMANLNPVAYVSVGWAPQGAAFYIAQGSMMFANFKTPSTPANLGSP